MVKARVRATAEVGAGSNFRFSGVIMADTDSQLIAQIKGGSSAALDALFKKYLDGVRRMVMYTVGNKDFVDDIVQESFVALQKSVFTFKEQSAFSTWLFSLVRNVSLQYIRKFVKNNPEYNENEHGQTVAADDRIEVIELNNALGLIPAHFRDPILLIEMEGFSYEETALILDIKVGTVKSRVHEAKKKLLALLNKGGADV